ncbi:Uncharacterized membrane protein YkvA, DUF1232 family [Dethiosulfatibacter aminovorans DSM 17477]|uniref:Uncharacterized membrane protein YkvA, DUF1232 family n=1 Tax=Dethiosulfatibacter aminovorans DSM 17477 TaxID=1121476 RepID=A0A1M6AC50_9FIRM|nr:YkvA family protein [Dethiosulfatibacter aminovorans]SHI33743.1 Uncharacterized membrane protein YkvA, DUF1232 family [Dethiosulfatibacter aminovorans DSM 17477]
MIDKKSIEKNAIERFSREQDDKWKKEAESLLEDQKKMEKMLKRAEKKLDERKKGPLRKLFDSINYMILMINDYASGEYREIPYGSIIMATAAVIYFVMPFDFVPDFIAGLGFIDDLAIITLVLKQVEADLEKYKDWREKRKSSALEQIEQT